ncbi:hypothetical protein D3C86_1284770 [compost metagenome]
MRVYRYITMSRKVLGRGHNPIILQSLHIRRAQNRYPFFIIPEGTEINYRIIRIVIDVYIGSKINMHTHAFTLVCNCCGHLFYQRSIAGRTQHHLPGKVLYPGQAHAKTPFSIHTDQQRYFGTALVDIGLLCLSFRSALHKNDTADQAVIDQRLYLPLVIFFASGVGGHHKQLAYALFFGKAVINAVYPFLPGILCHQH